MTAWRFILMAALSVLIAPLAEAVAKIDARTPIGAALRSDQWADVPLALRERAQFSANVTSVKLLQAIQDKLQARIGLVREQVAHGDALVDRSSFIADIRAIAVAEGVQTAGKGGAGTIRDIRSSARLGLIFDQQTRSAAGFADWKMGQDPDVLDAFPAQELVRLEERQVPRNWTSRWLAAGGPMSGSRMIALKTDPIWTKISRFGTPWPPFDYGSGMGVADVSRGEAESLGLLQPADTVTPIEADFNDGMKASVEGLDDKLVADLKQQFGDQIEISGGVARWRTATKTQPVAVTPTPDVTKRPRKPRVTDLRKKPIDQALQLAAVRHNKALKAMSGEPHKVIQRKLSDLDATAASLGRQHMKAYRLVRDYGTPSARQELARIRGLQQDLEAERKRLTFQVEEVQVAALALPKPAGLQPAYASHVFTGERKEAVEIAVDRVSRLVNIPEVKGKEIVVRAAPGNRASGSGQAINLTSHDGTKTAAHEIGHWIEDRVPHVHQRCIEFLEYRCAGEKPVSLRKLTGLHYDSSEVARKDRFFSPYCGKDYFAGGTRYATEILSMGLQRMAVDPAAFAAEDAEYFHFVYGLVRGTI
jgi:hypothetical protein